jgi:hypothetical protein
MMNTPIAFRMIPDHPFSLNGLRFGGRNHPEDILVTLVINYSFVNIVLLTYFRVRQTNPFR